MAALAFRVLHRCVLIFGLDDTHVARGAGGSQRSLCKQPAAPGRVGIVAADAICPDLHIPVAARVHILVALETKVQDRHIKLVRIGPGVGLVTGTTAVLKGRMDIGPRKFVVMTSLTGGCWFGGRNMRVVALLALIFLQSRVFKGVFVQVFVAGAALPDRDRLQ